jgi:ATP-binding cassette subfamily B multidrug efflux pump
VVAGGTLARIGWCAIRIRPMLRASERASEARSHLSGRLVDSVSNFMAVKLFAGGRREKESAKPDRAKVLGTVLDNKYNQTMFWGLPSMVEDLLLCGVFFICVYMSATGLSDIAGAVFAVSAYNMVSNKIWQIVWNLPHAMDNYGMASESYSKLVKPVSVADDENAPELAVTRGAISVKNVSFDYGAKKDGVLSSFSLDIAPGEKVGLVGVSGSGKTTLANLIMRLYDPKKGRIEIDGQDIRHVAQDSLRRQIAFIPQDSVLFHRSLADNIGYGRDGASRAEIALAAKKAGAHEFIAKAPKKYATLVGDRGIKLSGGQRQRVAIARAILKDAPILIMDEATSALDSETETAIQKSFGEVSRGKTTIVIAHRLSTLRNMDRIVVMKNGRIAESGTHEQLIKKRGGQYARLWRLQSSGFIKE